MFGGYLSVVERCSRHGPLVLPIAVILIVALPTHETIIYEA